MIWHYTGEKWNAVNWHGQLAGQRVIIACNGPSFNLVDAGKIPGRGRVVVGINSVYPKLRPDYWVGMDRAACFEQGLFFEAFPKIMRAGYDREKVANGQFVRDCNHVFFADVKREAKFFDWSEKAVFEWTQTTFLVALQMVLWMGARDIYLLGVDLNLSAGDYADGNYLTAAQRASNGALYDKTFTFLKTAIEKAEGRFSLTSCSEGSRINSIMPFRLLPEVLAECERGLPAGRPKLHVSDTPRMEPASPEPTSQPDPYSTHLEALAKAVATTTGPVLELGCGHYSTPLLRAFTKAAGRPFTIAAAPSEWSARYKSEADDFVEVRDWSKFEIRHDVGLCLLDNELLTRDRFAMLAGLLPWCRAIVVHDADRMTRLDGFRDLLRVVPHEWFKRFDPWTLVLRPSPPARNVVLVCRSGGDFAPEHVARMVAMLPECRVTVLSDLPAAAFPGCEVIALAHGWRGWWAKMELFRPDLLPWEPFLFIDLDATIHRIPEPWWRLQQSVALGPFTDRCRDVLQSSLMWLMPATRAAVWRHWIANPPIHMGRHRGDQDFLSERPELFTTWQRLFPGAIHSFKLHLRAGITSDARHAVTMFHGHPRPWHAACTGVASPVQTACAAPLPS
jgi:hypothetical protein